MRVNSNISNVIDMTADRSKYGTFGTFETEGENKYTGK